MMGEGAIGSECASSAAFCNTALHAENERPVGAFS